MLRLHDGSGQPTLYSDSREHGAIKPQNKQQSCFVGQLVTFLAPPLSRHVIMGLRRKQIC